LTVVFTLAAVRVMDSASYGAYLVLLGLVDLFRPLSSLGILQTVQQYLPELALHASARQFRTFLRWTRIIRWGLLLFVSVALYLLWDVAAAWLGFSAVTPIPAALPCAVIASVLAVEFVEQMLEALLDQKAVQLLRLFHVLGRLIALMSFAWFGVVSLEVVLYIEVVAAVVCWIAAEVVFRRAVGRIVPDGSRSFAWPEFARFAWHMAGAQALNAVSSAGALRLVVARVMGLEAAGLFGFMHTLMGQLNRLLPAIMLANLLRPVLIAQRVHGQLGRVADASALLWRSNFLFLWPLVPLVFLAGEPIVRLLSGGRIGDGLAFAGMYLALIAMAQAQVNAIILQVHKRSGDLVKAAALSLAAPLFVATGAQFSLAGAAFGLFAAYTVRSTFTTWLIQRSEARMKLDSRGALSFALAIAASGAVAALCQQFWPLPAAGAAYVVLVLTLVFLVKPLNQSDATVIADALGRPMPWMRWITSSTRP
jgi:hypothetical protein